MGVPGQFVNADESDLPVNMPYVLASFKGRDFSQQIQKGPKKGQKNGLKLGPKKGIIKCNAYVNYQYVPSDKLLLFV